MATCKSCGRDNQDLYKFCLGCGAELGDTAVEVSERLTAQVVDRTAQLRPKHSTSSKGPPTLGRPEIFDLKDPRDSFAHLKPLPLGGVQDEATGDTTDPNAGRICPQCG